MINKLFIPVFMTFFLFAGCLGETETQLSEFATGNLEAEFFYADNQEPVTGLDFNLLLVAEGTEQPVQIGIFTSDENGIIEAEIVGQEELTVVQAIFEYVDDNDELQTIEEDIFLEFRFEEPFDTVSSSFEI